MTSGAVSLTKGEGAGRQAGPAAAIIISMAAPMSEVRGAEAALRAAADGQRRQEVRGDVGRLRGVGGVPAAEEEPEGGEGDEPEEDERAEEAEGGERGHAGASRRRRRAAARVAA